MSLHSRLPEIAAELKPRVNEAVKHGAELIEQGAKARVPVETGKLRDAIHTKRVGLAEYAVIAGDSKAFYGHMVEHGTTRTPPRPFLLPAAEESRSAVEGLVVAALRRL